MSKVSRLCNTENPELTLKLPLAYHKSYFTVQAAALFKFACHLFSLCW